MTNSDTEDDFYKIGNKFKVLITLLDNLYKENVQKLNMQIEELLSTMETVKNK